MKKRLLASVLTLMMILSLVPTTALAAEDDIMPLSGDDTVEETGTPTFGICGAPTEEGGEVTDAVKWNFDSETGTLTIFGTGAMKDYYQINATAPDSRTTAPWVSNYQEQIKKVVIENGVTKVGTFAFAKCTNLAEVSYPQDCVLTRSCFKGCALTEITVHPGNISTADDIDCSYVFAENSKLTSVTFSDGITSIPEYYIDQACALSSITLPSTLTEVGTGAFRNIGKASGEDESDKQVTIIDNSTAVNWLEAFDSIFGSKATNITAINTSEQVVNISLPVGATLPMFSKIDGYTYVSDNASVVSIDGTTATTISEGTATVTGSKTDSMTIKYVIAVTDEAQAISDWDDLVTAFQYGGKYYLEKDLSYSLANNTRFDDGLLIADGVAIDLDLNGKTLSLTNVQRVFGTANGGKITLSNGGVASSGTAGVTLAIMRSPDDEFSATDVSFTTGDQYLVYADNGGTVSLEDCAVSSVTSAVVKDNKNSATVTIQNCNISVTAISGTNTDSYTVSLLKVIGSDETVTGPLTISSGITYKLEGGTINGDIIVEEGGTLIVNDGTINGTITTAGTTTITGGTIQKSGVNSDNGVIHVTGGNFNMSGGAITATGTKARAISFAGSGTISGTISGGTFTGSDIALLVQQNANNSVTVTGGKFVSASGHTATILDRQGVIATGYGVYRTDSDQAQTKDSSNCYKGNDSDYTLNVYPNPDSENGTLVIPYTAKDARSVVASNLTPTAIINYTFVGWYSTADCKFDTQKCGILSDPADTDNVYALFSSKVSGTVTAQSDTSYGSVTYSSDSSTVQTPALGHNYAYSASGAVITEICTLDCTHSATASISAPTDLQYNNSPKEASVSYSDSWQGGTLSITYTQNNNTLTNNPKDAGTYTATISVGEGDAEVTAGVEFEITKATPTISISASSETLTGGGNVTLTISGVPTEGTVTVTCDDTNYNPTLGTDNKYTVTLPNEAKTYTFKAVYAATNNYNVAEAEIDVQVTRYTGGGSSSSSSSSTYAVSVDTSKNGTVTVSPKNASKGTTVTITVKPDSGYELDELTVTDKNGSTVKLTKKSDTQYTFTMPAGKVTVEASFVKETVAPSVSFTDVQAGVWYYDAALYAAENDLMSGTGNGAFSPDLTTSRAMIWTILARVDGQNISVTYGNWYDKAQAWAISAGVSDGTNPDSAITREQLAVMLYGFAKEQGYTTANGVSLSRYVDASDVSAWAVEALEWAVGNGLISSMGNNILAPTGTATRAQVAVILMNFCENIAK